VEADAGVPQVLGTKPIKRSRDAIVEQRLIVFFGEAP